MIKNLHQFPTTKYSVYLHPLLPILTLREFLKNLSTCLDSNLYKLVWTLEKEMSLAGSSKAASWNQLGSKQSQVEPG